MTGEWSARPCNRSACVCMLALLTASIATRAMEALADFRVKKARQLAEAGADTSQETRDLREALSAIEGVGAKLALELDKFMRLILTPRTDA